MHDVIHIMAVEVAVILGIFQGLLCACRLGRAVCPQGLLRRGDLTCLQETLHAAHAHWAMFGWGSHVRERAAHSHWALCGRR